MRDEANRGTSVLKTQKPHGITAEFSSLNCYYCIAYVVGSTSGIYLRAAGTSSGVPTVPTWTYVGFESTVNGVSPQCLVDIPSGTSYGYFAELIYTDGWAIGGYPFGTSIVGVSGSHAYTAPGLYTAELDIGCGCSGFGEVFVAQAQRSVQVCQAPPDTLAVNTSLAWPSQEPWERGASLWCRTNGAVADYFRDSFGMFYSGYTPTMDPCGVNLVSGGGTGTLIGGVHKHPYFTTASQYTAGIGCGGDTQSPTAAELNAVNSANNNFGPGDPNWNSQTGTPLYLRTPTGSQVKRRAVNGSVTTVYP
jgi:hypothetical protein